MSSAASHAMVTDSLQVKDRMLNLMNRWAAAGAYLDTVQCWKGGRGTGACTEWTQADGQDLSDAKDSDTVAMWMASLRTSYYAAISDHRPERSADHARIRAWFSEMDRRLKRPGDVYFGLKTGWYWPAIEIAASEGRTRQAKSLARKLNRELSKLMLPDGSIKDRTTRGDRALWYHATAISEIVHAHEIQRALGESVPKASTDKLHLSVNLFIRSVVDPSVIDPWARQALNARYRPNHQEYDRSFWNNEFGHSWLHVYSYRYPDRPEAQWLRKSVPKQSRSAVFDEDIGLAVGCIYNAAAAAR